MWPAVIAKVGIILSLAAVAVTLGGPLVTRVFFWAERRKQAEQTAEDGPSPDIAQAATVLRGGAWIGRLERLAIFACIVSGYPDGVAYALALKGLARYPELRATTSGAAERFIIGTFVSALFGAACAGLAWWLVRLF